MPDTSLTAVRLNRFFSVDPRERVFTRYAEGIGSVREDGQGLSIAMNVYDEDGHADGTQICSGDITAKNLNELMRPPKNPDVRFGDPGPVTEVPVTARCKATWKFADGSSITAIGKGTSHLVPLNPADSSLPAGPGVVRAGLLADRAALVITNGTGQYAGARGMVTINSSVFLPDLQKAPIGQPGAEVRQKSIHQFSVVLGDDVAP